MLRALARRLASGAGTLFLITCLVFALAHLAPGGPAPGADAEGEEVLRRLTAAREAELRGLYHLDEPLHRQYRLWLSDLLRGDLGLSFHDRRPVADKIAERIGTTVTLNALALIVMFAASLPVGGLAASRPGSRFDRLSGAVASAAYAVPAFWAALLLQITFSVRLGWLPLFGLASEGAASRPLAGRIVDLAAHLALPVACLSYGGLAYLSRFVRTNLIESAFGESARAARAKGIGSARLLFGHGLRQAAIPLLTLAGFLLPALVAGSVIVESVFSIPGLGLLFTDAVRQRDVPVIMALTLLSGTATVAGIFAADSAYQLADPRMARGGNR